ncbi:MAG: DUF423 domain-containing protein [Cyclobacteriaceae bacterium]|nr:DUF423 domain-containing protein [Cyclobacteriaceae bacterium]
MNIKTSLILASFFMALAVALGAFGAHALKDMLTESGRLDSFETAVRYQMIHAIGLFVTSLIAQSMKLRFQKTVALLFTIGIFLFSGSIYLICFTDITAFGMVAPVGGTAFIAAWVLHGMSLFKATPPKNS